MENNKKILAQTLFIIFLFLINFIFILCLYYYLYYVPVMAFHAEIASLHEKNNELEDALAEVLKKQEGVEQIKKPSIFSLTPPIGCTSPC